MNLEKFISIISTKSLYFANATELDDPFEGYLPPSHMDALSSILQGQLDEMKQATSDISELFGEKSPNEIKTLDELINKMGGSHFMDIHKRAIADFGVQCWHINEGESYAMWKIYTNSGQGIAIESTVGRLKESLRLSSPNVTVKPVRYVNFENASIDKNLPLDMLYVKRSVFAYERELRATVPDLNGKKGVFVHCDLDCLIKKIHISPSAPDYLAKAVEVICEGIGANKMFNLGKPIESSKMFDPPKTEHELNVDL